MSLLYYFHDNDNLTGCFTVISYHYMCVCNSCPVCLYVQGVLTSAVPTDGLAEADRLTLGQVKVWGVTAPVTRVTMSVTGQPDADLPFTYNAEVRSFMQTYTST